MRKIISTIALALSLAASATAQQDAQYTSFMFNKLALNPAFAGNHEVAALSLLYRNQWSGFEGAPNTQTISFHAPFADGQRMGLGINLQRDAIAFYQNWFANISYAYRIPVGEESRLSVGLQGGLRFARYDWTKADPAQFGDTDLPTFVSTKYLPNVGAGVYFQNPHFYAGFSVPELLNNNLDFTINGTLQETVQRRHVFTMLGGRLDLNENIAFTPNAMIKYVSNAPLSADINLSLLFFERFSIGTSYRTGNMLSGLMNWYVTPQMRLGLAYDYTLNKLQNYNNGSFEVMLGYDFFSRGESVYNPRYYFF